MSRKILLLSIHQKYANMILNGDKQVELRRVRPRHLNEGDLMLVYVTSPKKSLLGVLEVEKVLEMPPSKLWESVSCKAGISHECFQKYYEKSMSGFAIFFKKSLIFKTPIKLEELKQHWSDFRPPQCYQYLKDKEINFIESIANCNIINLSKSKIDQTKS